MPTEKITIPGGELHIQTPELPGVDPTNPDPRCPDCGARLRWVEELHQGKCNMCGPGSERHYQAHPEERPLAHGGPQGAIEDMPAELRDAIRAQAEVPEPGGLQSQGAARGPEAETREDIADAAIPVGRLPKGFWEWPRTEGEGEGEG